MDDYIAATERGGGVYLHNGIGAPKCADDCSIAESAVRSGQTRKAALIYIAMREPPQQCSDGPECESSSSSQAGICFHCLEPLSKYSTVFAEIAGEQRAFCCYGCQTAAQYIEDDQLTEFYQRRGKSRNQVSGSEAMAVNAGQADWSFLDDPALAKDYVTETADGERELSVQVHGLYCASCAWLIDNAMSKYSDGIAARVDIDAKRLFVSIRNPEVKIAGVLSIVEKLGYQPAIISLGATEDPQAQAREEQHLALKRIAVAGFGMMQVMTYMLAVYLGEFHGMEESFHRFLTLVSMLVATAVVFYSGKPFFDNALNDIANRHLGMDVPIALAIAGAYFPSVYLTLLNRPGHIYFDSAVMFIFFLSVGRYVEARARHRLAGSSNELGKLLPPLIEIKRGGQRQHIKPKEAEIGDQIHLTHKQRLPFDGTVVDGEALIDESLISGESIPVLRKQGDRVLAGSIVIGEGIEIQATAAWSDSSMAKISRFLNKASAAQGEETTTFDYLARYFVLFVLVLTALVGIVWWSFAPDRVFEIVLAMLVASCPCAFALAGPVGVAAASHVLRLKGLLVANFKALRVLPNITTWVFDKTGTLTRGRPEISSITCYANTSEDDALRIAASLEQDNQHVLSYAFSTKQALSSVEDLERIAGHGVAGDLEGRRYYLGKPSWVMQQSGITASPKGEVFENEHASLVALADNTQLIAVFTIEDQLRPQAKAALQQLKAQGDKLIVMSGDRKATVDYITRDLPLDSARANLLPEQKVDNLHALQAGSELVAMVGDGVNDAPVIAQADVSLAMSSGSEVSQAQADVIILNGQLSSLTTLVEVARVTSRITRQNLGWALAYNGIALPLAAFGLITPWLAALGMSISSLLVVVNALRISHVSEPNSRPKIQTAQVA